MSATHPELDLTQTSPEAATDPRVQSSDYSNNRRAVDALVPRLSVALDVFVVCAVLLVATAVGIALIDRVGASPAVAFIGAGALLVTLVASHIVIRRASALRQVRQALYSLEAEVERLTQTAQSGDQELKPRNAEADAQVNSSVSVGAEPKPSGSDQPEAVVTAKVAPADPPLRADPLAEAGDDRGQTAQMLKSATPGDAMDAPARAEAKPTADAKPTVAALPPIPAPPASPNATAPEPLRYTSPAEPLQPQQPAPPPPLPMPLVAASDEQADRGDNTSDDNAVVKSMLSRLAADISAAPETDSGVSHDDDAHRRLAEGAELVRDTAGTSAARASEPNLSDAFVADGEIADALAATAPAPAPDQTALTPDADPLDIGPAVTETTTETGGDDARLAAIASALSAEQIDVFLEPIKLLDNVGAPHFEVTLRLRLDDGTELDRDGYGDATHGTPLLPLIDTLAAAKTRSATWKLMQRDKVGRVFTSVSGGSLGSDQFSDDMSAIFSGERETAERMVLSFPQSDARALTKRDRETLAQLKRAGFAFAIDHVTDLETDFSDLNDCGFAFVKLDAEIFLDGLQVGMTRVPSDDICRHLGSLGLTPIVGHVRDVTQLQKLRTCGVRLAQGPLLGAPRALKSDWFGAGA